MFDILQGFFWSITYILIIAYSFREKIIGIPPIALATNFAWETNALLRDLAKHIGLTSSAAVIRLVWFLIDLIIFLVYFLHCKPVRFSKWTFVCFYLIESVCFCGVFYLFDNGQVLSSFFADIIMAVAWYFYGKNKAFKVNAAAVCMAFTKLLGDCFAWLYYFRQNLLINIIGICVLIINTGYVFVLFRRIKENKTKEIYQQKE